MSNLTYEDKSSLLGERHRDEEDPIGKLFIRLQHLLETDGVESEALEIVRGELKTAFTNLALNRIDAEEMAKYVENFAREELGLPLLGRQHGM